MTAGWAGENIHQATRITPKVGQKSSPRMSGKSFGVAAFPTDKVGIVMNILKVVAFKFNSYRLFKLGAEIHQRNTVFRIRHSNKSLLSSKF